MKKLKKINRFLVLNINNMYIFAYVMQLGTNIIKTKKEFLNFKGIEHGGHYLS